MNSAGFIVIHRKLLEWKYVQFPHALALWVYILIRANWKDGYFLGVLVPRGSLATSIRNLSKETGMDQNTIRKWLKRFEEDGMITTKTTNRFTHIFISNYAAFQDISEKQNSTQGHTLGHTQSSEQSSTQPPPNRTKKQINKNNKETKSIEGPASISDFGLLDELKAEAEKQEKPAELAEPEKPKEEPFDSFASWRNIPSLDMIAETVSEEGLGINPEKFYDYYSARDWHINGKPIKDWRKLLRTWAKKEIRETAAVTIPLPDHFKKAEPEPTAEEDDAETIRLIREMQAKMQ